MDAEQFRREAKDLLEQVNRLDSAKDHRGAIDVLARGIEMTEGFLRDHPEMSAEFGSMLPDWYYQRAFYGHRLSQAPGTKDRKELLALARKDIAKAMSFPDAYYTRGKAHLKRLEGMIK